MPLLPLSDGNLQNLLVQLLPILNSHLLLGTTAATPISPTEHLENFDQPQGNGASLLSVPKQEPGREERGNATSPLSTAEQQTEGLPGRNGLGTRERSLELRDSPPPLVPPPTLSNNEARPWVERKVYELRPFCDVNRFGQLIQQPLPYFPIEHVRLYYERRNSKGRPVGQLEPRIPLPPPV